jgi:hypothetical protein
MNIADNNKQTEAGQPPIGIAGLACFGCLAVVYLATRPVIGFLDRWGIQWLLYTLIPISAVFVILYRSSWHRELPTITRTLSMLLSAAIIFVTVFLVAGLLAAGVCIFISGGMVSR